MIPVLTDLSIRIGLVFDALNRENHPLSAKSIIYTKIGPVQARKSEVVPMKYTSPLNPLVGQSLSHLALQSGPGRQRLLFRIEHGMDQGWRWG